MTAKRRTTKERRTRGSSSRRSEEPGGPSSARRRARSEIRSAGEPTTVVYVHGIGNKPVASVLKCQWDQALFRVQMGDRTRMAYWVNRQRFPEPLPAALSAGDRIDVGRDPELLRFGLGAREIDQDDGAWLDAEVSELATSRDQAPTLASLGERLLRGADPAPRGRRGTEVKFAPLPPALRQWLTRRITRLFLRDVNDFLFNTARRRDMERAVLERLGEPRCGPLVVIAHSQGSMIAYEALRKLPATDYDVRLLLTFGSPLGMPEMQDELRRLAGTKTLKVPSCVRRWVNVSERLDPVSLDASLADDFSPKRFVEDRTGWGVNQDAPRHPHSATGYLRSIEIESAMREAAGNTFFQVVTDFTLARDLVADLEDAEAGDRHPVLIELSDRDGETRLSADEVAVQLEAELRQILVDSWPAAEVDRLKRYLAAKLTRKETEILRARHGSLNVHRVWRDARKTALIDESAQRVQASAARVSFRAAGQGIEWAVLDTGVNSRHPHFAPFRSVKASWNCTRPGAPTGLEEESDGHGHGTHVAGIIAGSHEVGQRTFSGIAPQARLHVYKVLDDTGDGRDSWIIKALDHISRANEQAGDLAIHGINLSLGGPYDPNVYGCGHSPLCNELRRLWRQGVVVVLAAGNEGYAVLQSDEGPIDATMDLSIGDPANLEESIAVGSVHRSRPHAYGVSFFSSRGPTSDGRRKPDVVAPGEKIWSARHDFDAGRPATPSAIYARMSGTSMAAPHVSGVVAAFLSVRREFIGNPDRIKQILCDNCTDLDRDPYIQGHGLPNLMKMLTNT